MGGRGVEQKLKRKLKMNYYEYIQSADWKQFRKEILSKRICCQKCGIKKGLQLHHKHYRTLGKEKSSDIIVLCKECHFRFHKKSKWKKIKNSGGIMDFTKTTIPNNPLYNLSEVLKECNRCGEKHPLFYKIFKNGRKVLSMACPNSKPRITFLPFEELNLPILANRKKGAVDNSDLK